ncbi:MAG: hypothetical protein EHM70_05780 [Chloroflexota bacterium]|nr:MAG: hypothetical protein EHM70_05780 [Chloroflexota bacterium]
MEEMDHWIAELTSGEDQRAEAAVSNLAALGDEALPALIQLLASAAEDDRWWATRTLAEISSPETPMLLLQAFGDEQVDVRKAAALALRQQPHPDSIPALVAALDDEDRILARLAGSALAANGEQATQVLLDVLEKGSHAAQIEALRALASIGDKRSIPALLAAFEKDSSLMEYWANEGLERMGVGMSFLRPS